MTTIGRINLAIQAYLQEMNLSPYEVTITKFRQIGDEFFIHGDFQRGFMGDSLVFKATFNSQTNEITDFEILGEAQ